ncbi:MAG: hypothetical protein QGM50_06275 [Anaerolineae bacterium]|nr:hypothetical protein [Anaerolineae bacterium]
MNYLDSAFLAADFLIFGLLPDFFAALLLALLPAPIFLAFAPFLLLAAVIVSSAFPTF